MVNYDKDTVKDAPRSPAHEVTHEVRDVGPHGPTPAR